ncbi:histidine phosphatase family protein [Bradyrhizobium retamae]|nr:histidine phosphatase family protein [Bradyrhizobium retamae]
MIRHGVHDIVDDILVGRAPGVRLNSRGREQARRLAECLGRKRIDLIQSSPQTRAQETIEPIAQRLGMPIEVSPEIDELDMGEWTGRSFAALNQDPRWSQWNSMRGTARPPNGESMSELQMRAVSHLARISSSMPKGHVALCSHAEVIRAIALYALKLPLDDFHRVDIAPATISTLAIERDGFEITALNQPVAS